MTFDVNTLLGAPEGNSLLRLLSFSLSEDKAREASEKLLLRYGSLHTVMSESLDEICRVGGISVNTALLIKLTAYVNSRRVIDGFEFGRAHGELELRELIRSLFLGASVETVYAILFDEQGRVVSAEFLGEGTVNASDVYPRKLLECASKKKAKSVILAHNHPKGSVNPSSDDVMTTGRLFAIFSSAGIRLRAHYIVADGEIGRIEMDALYNPDSARI